MTNRIVRTRRHKPEARGTAAHTLPYLLSAAVESDPSATALSCGDRTLTYAELDARSARLARALIARGLGAEDRVLLALPRSVDAVIALWAVAKSGAAFVPVDPDAAPQWIADPRARLGLTHTDLVGAPTDSIEWLVLNSDRCRTELAGLSSEPLYHGDRVRRLRADSAACELDDVTVTQAGLTALCSAQIRRTGIGSGSRVLHLAPTGSAVAILELLLTFAAGATAVLAPQEITDAGELMRTQRVTHAHLPPALLAELDPTGLPELTTLLVDGIACPPDLLDRWSPGRAVLPLYGSAETSIAALIDGQIPGLSARVLDERLRPVPPGMAGELYLTGASLARGYRNRPGHTASRFIAHPGGRMYRTGDMVRWVTGADGLPRLQLLGRALQATRLQPDATPRPRVAARYRAPITRSERIVAAAIIDLLGVPRVGVDDDFFDLGGNSLLATRLAGRVGADAGVRVAARTVFEYGTVAALAAAIDRLHHTEAVVRLRPRERGERVPMALAQQRIWFLARLDPDSAAHNIPIVLRLSGDLDVTALRAALGDLLERHEVLRTVYPEFEGEGYQLILPAPRVIVYPEPAHHTETALPQAIAELVGRGFDITREVPLRVRLFRMSDSDHVLAVVIHHIAADGFSLGPLTRDLMTAYQARTAAAEPAWTPLPVQYADFALWQREILGAAADSESLLATQLRFWRETLAGLPPLLELPADRPRPPIAGHRGATYDFQVDARLHRALEALARERGVSLFMLIHAALAVVLARGCDTDDVVVGAPVAGRGEPELDDLVGMFVNTLVLRTRIDAAEPFTALLDRVRAADLAAFANAELPFEQLVAELDPPRSQAHHPLFQVALVFQNFEARVLRLPGLTVTAVESGDEIATVDLRLTVLPPDPNSAAGLRCSWRYATDLFDPDTVAALARQLVAVLRAVVARPRLAVGDLPLLDDAEPSAMLGPEHPVPQRFLPSLLDEQARLRPDGTALSCAETSLTYGELARRVNRLARLLIALGIGPGTTVALAMRPCPELVIGLYAILQAGGAYVPVHPDHPADRRAEMIRTAAPLCVLTTAHDDIGHTDRAVVQVDRLLNSEVLSGFSNEPVTDAERLRPLRAADLAYVIFTSGSTGRPKGVAVPHAAIANQTAFLTAEYQLTEADTFLQMAPFTFDASMIGFTAPLAVGARLVLASDDGQRDPRYLADAIARHGVTATNTVPSLLRALLDLAPAEALATLRAVWVGGEPLPAGTIERFSAICPGGRLHNLYGPTEATVSITAAEVTGLADGPVPIGRTHWNCRAYVLDSRLHPVPPNTPGELYLAGPQLARGYLGETGRTAERFVADPFGRAGTLMYRTGDRVRRTRDGVLEYLGRTDFQLKLRGLRIEPGEVEAALRAHPTVTDAAVAVRAEQLVGYITGDDPDPVDVLTIARKRLPGYMIPAQVLRLPRLPSGPTGKLDRAALPEPPAPAREFRAPATVDERIVAEVFATVLGVDRVGREDDFFALGGTSLSAIRIRAALTERLGLDLPLRRLFTYPRVGDLAAALRSDRISAADAPDPRADAILDPSIDPADCAPPHQGEPAAVLLTGATGFLGAFLLRELLEHTSATIHCLVRATDDHAARARILATAERYRIDLDARVHRIVAVAGDLAQPRLGLDTARFDELAERIDTILHNGALVNHLEPYARMRAANVHGATEVLRLAATVRVKPVHYVSTVSVPAGAPAAGSPPMGVPDYVVTKWVAEQLITAATLRGIPTAIHRPGLITGDSRTGAAGTDDAWWTMLRAMLVLGLAPDFSAGEIEMVPVDHVAAAIVRRLGEAGATYHLVPPHPTPLRALVTEIRRRGYRLDLVEPEYFREVLTTTAEQRAATGDDTLARAAALSINFGGAVGSAAPAPTPDPEPTIVVCPTVDTATLGRYFDHFVDVGFFPAPRAMAETVL